MFQLIFRGECQPGTDVEAARNNARALFKASVEQVDRMFSGRPVVIRNRLEQEQAEKYRTVLARHGMVVYVEPMADSKPATPAPPPPAAAPSPRSSETPRAMSSAESSASQPGPRVEPGDRLPVAGDRVDEVLATSRLGLDPTGTRLSEEKHAPAPMFEHLDDWSIAPAGTDLGVERDTPPPVVPDVSHLALADEPDPDDSTSTR